MRIRTQIIVAFLLLSVLPLTAIVLYSYFTSIEAVQQAYEEETTQLTREMNVRIAEVREGIDEALERAGELPGPVLVGLMRRGDQPAVQRVIAETLGSAAPLLEKFEFVPVKPAAPAKPIVVDVESIVREAKAEGGVLSPEQMREIESEIRRSLAGVNESPTPGAPVPEPAAVPEVTSPEPATPAQPVEDVAEALPPEAAEEMNAFEETRREAASMEDARRRLDERMKALAKEQEALARSAPDDRERERIARRMEIVQQRMASLAERQSRLLLGRDFEVPIEQDGEVIGKIRAQISGEQVVAQILGSAERDEGEIPFAMDTAGNLYTATKRDEERLGPIRKDLQRADNGARVADQWVVASSRDAESGLQYGIARPMAARLQQIRRTAARNFTYGLALIAVALIGIIPIANHMTRDLESLRSGSERIAQGDFQTRLPVRSGNEIGQLARAFNRMAHDLSVHEQTVLERERMQQEYTRKTEELEEARRFQLSLLPKDLPAVPGLEVAVMMRTATEVGGDYYDFHVSDDGVLTTAIGDATGHGARAATMVTVLKSLFAAGAATGQVSQFLKEAAETIRRMGLGRMAMAFTLARFHRGKNGTVRLVISSAGMPPALLYRGATGAIEEIVVAGLPLGTLALDYAERSFDMTPGDILVLMTDGLPELMNRDGEPFGYTAVQKTFAKAASHPPASIVDAFGSAAETWSAGHPQNDDMTFVVIRVS